MYDGELLPAFGEQSRQGIDDFVAEPDRQRFDYTGVDFLGKTRANVRLDHNVGIGVFFPADSLAVSGFYRFADLFVIGLAVEIRHHFRDDNPLLG